MIRRILPILLWFSLAATLLFGAAFGLNFRTDFAYSSGHFEAAVSHFHIIVMTRDPADLAMQKARYGWSFKQGMYINNPGVQHWRTVAPWGTGTAVPLWMPLAASGGLTLAFGAPSIFRRRKRPGHCPACGYDLRGLPAGASCPECGGNRLAPRGGPTSTLPP